MQITDLSKLQQQLIQGEVIAYPTEAVFGLGCDPLNQQAVEKLLALKQRSVEKGLILVASKPESLEKFVDLHNQIWLQQVLDSWADKTQAITWLIPKKSTCPAWLTGKFETLAVRVSNHPVVRELCDLMPDGVLVSTSANPHNQSPALSCDEVKNYFGESLICVAGELGKLDQPSKIFDAKTGARLR